MRVVVIGTGYVGLVSGACFADIGHNVTCVDKNPAVLERLGRGEIPIYEPGLDAVVARGVEAGRLNFAATPDVAIQQADVVFIAVGTPPDDQGDANLSYVFGAAKEIAPAMAGVHRRRYEIDGTRWHRSRRGKNHQGGCAGG